MNDSVKDYLSYYDWLKEYLPEIFTRMGINWDTCGGIIGAHGDKGYGYRDMWENAGLEFHKAMAVYLAGYVRPYADECRDVDGQWVDPSQWVVDNYHRFADVIEEVSGSEE